MSDYTNIHVFEEFTENVSMDIGVERQLPLPAHMWLMCLFLLTNQLNSRN